MFEHRNSSKKLRKRLEISSKISYCQVRFGFYVKKNSKLSHACVPLTGTRRESKELPMSAHVQRTSTSWARPMRGAGTRTPPVDTQSPGIL